MTRSHAVHREEKTVADPLATYLEDHIAGASYAIASSGRFATSVTGEPLAEFAVGMLAEVEADETALEMLVAEWVGSGASGLTRPLPHGSQRRSAA